MINLGTVCSIIKHTFSAINTCSNMISDISTISVEKDTNSHKVVKSKYSEENNLDETNTCYKTISYDDIEFSRFLYKNTRVIK